MIRAKVVVWWTTCASSRPWGGLRVLKFCRMGILAMRLPALSKMVRVRLDYRRYLI